MYENRFIWRLFAAKILFLRRGLRNPPPSGG